MKKSRKRLVYEQRIYRVQDYISTHFDQELNLEKLAQISAFSPFHFHRIFKAIAGETLYDFIQRIRLEKSCAMLSSDNDMRIIDIALCCGFSTPSSFSKAFKQRYNISPSEWRNGDYRKNSNSGKQISNNGTYESKTGKEKHSPAGYSRENDLEQNRRKKMNVKIEVFPEYRIAYMRQIGPYGPDNVQLMEKLKKWAAARELLAESAIILGIAHDDPDITPPEKCRYDCCIVIPDDYKPESNINENKLPGGRYAVYQVKHTAADIGNAWNDIFSVWLPDSGYQIDDRPIFERYAGTMEEVTCEICIPVKAL